MAFRSRRRFSRMRNKRKYHWHAEQAEAALGAGSVTTLNLLEPADYASNAALSPSGVTLYRIILKGSLACLAPIGASRLGVVRWMIVAVDKDVAPLGGVDATTLTDERVLACGTQLGGHTVIGTPTTDVVVPVVRPFEVDTRVRVKLQDTDIKLVFETVDISGSIAWEFAVVARLLVVGDTT